MFGLFSSSKINDKRLGELIRSRGYWRCTIAVDSYKNVQMAISGSRTTPNPSALATAQEVAIRFLNWRPQIAQALFEHFEPYAEAISIGEIPPPAEPLPAIKSPSDVWPYVSLQFVSVDERGGLPIVELGLNVSWDEEHILGACFKNDHLVELCGSTVPP